MKIKLLTIGKNRQASIATLCQDYLQRINHWQPVELHEIPSPVPSAKVPRAKALNTEAKAIEKMLHKNSKTNFILIALDERGTTLSSTQLATRMEGWLGLPKAELIFLIGGAYGLDESLKQQADFMLSLSKLTLPHQLAKLTLLEQIYRALSIIKKTPYHHD